MTIGQMSVSIVPDSQMSHFPMLIGKMSVRKMFLCLMPVGLMPVGLMPVGLMPVGLMPAWQMSVGKTIFDQKTLHLHFDCKI